MNYLKMIGLGAIVAIALMVISASTASATTFAINGKPNTKDAFIEASAESSIKWEKTDHTFANTCTASSIFGNDNTKTTGSSVEGPLTFVTFEHCTNEAIEVDTNGTVSVENIPGTLNGTLKFSGTKWTVPSPFGLLTCESGTGNDIGTFTGKSSGQATIDIKAVLNCGLLAPTALWEGSYTVTGGPNGVTA